MEITQRRLMEAVNYDSETGVLTSKVERRSKTGCGRSVKEGQVLGSFSKKGCVQITLDGRTYLAHRLAWLYVNGEFPKEQIDHIDGDRSNNAISNLRSCSQAENNQNTAKSKGVHTSKFVGVCFAQSIGYWIASVRVGGRQTYKYSKTEQGAVSARAELKAKHHTFNPFDREAA